MCRFAYFDMDALHSPNAVKLWKRRLGTARMEYGKLLEELFGYVTFVWKWTMHFIVVQHQVGCSLSSPLWERYIWVNFDVLVRNNVVRTDISEWNQRIIFRVVACELLRHICTNILPDDDWILNQPWLITAGPRGLISSTRSIVDRNWGNPPYKGLKLGTNAEIP